MAPFDRQQRDPQFARRASESEVDPNVLEELSRPGPRRQSGSSVVAWCLVVILIAALGFFSVLAVAPLKQQLHQTQALLVTANRDSATLSEQLETLKKAQATLLSERDGLAHKVDAVSEKETQLGVVRVEIERALAKPIARGDVTLRQKDGRLTLSFVDQLLFAGAEARLIPDAEELLDSLSKAVALVKDQALFEVAGHTDSTPIASSLKHQFASVWGLTAMRAISVLCYLAEKNQLAAENLQVVGYGAGRPLASNDTEAGRRRNRRVDISIVLPDTEN